VLRALANEYARAHGYDPRGHWTLIVHADDSIEFFRFERREDMWCCELEAVIKAMIAEELASDPQPRPLAQHRPFRAYLRKRLGSTATAG
jgi:hypothetical protein